MRKLFSAATAVACALMAAFASMKVQAQVVTLYCIITTYEQSRPVLRTIGDLKIDYDDRTVNDRPVIMSNKEKVARWKYTDIENGVSVSSSLNKVTHRYSSTEIRRHLPLLQHQGICKSCNPFSCCHRVTRRQLKAFYRC